MTAKKQNQESVVNPEAPSVIIPPAPAKRRGRKPGAMTPALKEAAAAARQKTKEDRDAAREALSGNVQFTDPKTWEKVDAQIINGVCAAIEKVKSATRKARLAELEAELAAIKGEMAETGESVEG